MSLLAGALSGATFCGLVLALRAARLAGKRSQLLGDSRREAALILEDAETRRRDEDERRRRAGEAEGARREEEWQGRERRLAHLEAAHDRRQESLESRERRLEEREALARDREADQDHLRAEHQELVRRARDELLALAGLSRDEALARVLARLDDEIREEAAERLRRHQERVAEEAEDRARRVLADAMARVAVEGASQCTTAVVRLAQDDLKGRLIGRDGRNIRAFEQATGVDLVVDDAPGVVVVSCFDAVRREVARRAVERLLADGRVHPARIEEVVAATRAEIDEDVRQTGRRVVHELDLPRVDARLQHCIGRLKYRTSYGQNQLRHAVEVAHLTAAIAGELGLNARLARRCGLLHDVGKAMDHVLAGGHAALGADLARRCGERPEVVNAIEAHHGDEPCGSVYAVLAQIADAVSAARPGARRDTTEKYIQRLERLEEIARAQPGVAGAFAIQAGREVRVLVDARQVDDAGAVVRAREIARRIEAELTHPGEVRVTVIRETRVTEYAR